MSEYGKFIPMEIANNERLRTAATLPFNIHKTVGIETNRVERLMQLSGIRSLQIVSDYDGERSNTSFQTVGINTDGSAIAGKGISKSVTEYTDNVNIEDDDYPNTRKQATWVDLKMTLNIPEMTRMILDCGEKVTDSKIWAKMVDSSIRSSVRKNGTNFLLSRSKNNFETSFVTFLFLDDIAHACNIGFADFLFNQVNPHALDPIKLSSNIILRGLMWTLFESLSNGKERPGSGRRFSFFYGLELDRAMALQFESRVGNVAKSLLSE